MQTVEDQILSFTAAKRGIKQEEMTLGDTLVQDLGMDGDDAVEFFEAFGKTFQVNLEPLWLHWQHHFRSEGFLFDLPFRRPQKPITVQDLVECVRSGQWPIRYSGE